MTSKLGFDRAALRFLFFNMLIILCNLKKARVVHRGIKPENLCINENVNLVLVDFEIAVQLLQTETIAREDIKDILCDDQLTGTSLYIPPETFHNLEYSFASDMWAVANVVCDLHSHVLPWNMDEIIGGTEVFRIITCNEATKPPNMDDAIWGLLQWIYKPREQRITCEEALVDSLFRGLSESALFGFQPDTKVIR